MRQITFQKTLQASTVREANLGEVAFTPDGREWRYVKANEALSLGHVATRIANTDVDTVSSATDGNGDITRISEASAGWTVAQFDDAYGLVDDGTGEGQHFKVQTNTTDTLRLYKDYALTTALAVGDSDIVLARPYLAEKVAVTTLNQILLGVAQVAFAANDYGWLLTRGPGIVIMGDVGVANEQITPGDDTEGEAIAITNGETPDDISSVGRVLVANTTADKGALIDVNIW